MSGRFEAPIRRGRRLLGLIGRLDAVLAALCLSAMVVLVLVQIVLRNVFQTGLEGADVLVRHLVLWVVFLGAGMAAREHLHIRIDALPRFLPARLRPVADGLVLLFSLGVLGVLCFAALRFVIMEYEGGMTLPGLDTPVWLVETIIPLGYAIIAVHLAVQGLKRVLDRKDS